MSRAMLGGKEMGMKCRVVIVHSEDRPQDDPFIFPISVDKPEDFGLGVKAAMDQWRKTRPDKDLMDVAQLLVEKI